MVESDLLRNLRLMKEKRELKLKALGSDPIAEIEKCSMNKRKAIIDNNYKVPYNNTNTDCKIILKTCPAESASEALAMDEFESNESDATPRTERKSKWTEMAKEREQWDQEPIAKPTVDPPLPEGEPISATGPVRPRFEVLSAKQQVERALLRSGKPDAKE